MTEGTKYPALTDEEIAAAWLARPAKRPDQGSAGSDQRTALPPLAPAANGGFEHRSGCLTS